MLTLYSVSIGADDNISQKQMTWLEAHYRAPNHVITATELAKLVGYKDHRGVNRWYGELGKQVANQVGYQKPSTDYTYLSTFVTFERLESPYPMELRPNFVKALEELGWV